MWKKKMRSWGHHTPIFHSSYTKAASISLDQVERIPYGQWDPSEFDYRWQNGAQYPWGEVVAQELGLAPVAHVIFLQRLPWVLEERCP